MSRASHTSAFLAGVIVAGCFVAHAVPPGDVARFKTLDTFAQALATAQTSYVDPVDEKTLIYNATRGMLHNLDQYSTFLPPKRYKNLRQDTEGEFGSIGVLLAPGMNDDARPNLPPYPTIDEIVPRSPADMAGLQLDDRVVSIDGQATAEPGKELANATTWEQKLRGASGTRVSLTVQRAGWKDPKPFTLVRAQIKQPSVSHRLIEKGIGYLAIARFSEATSADTAAALAKLRQQHGLGALVLDLRGDPGGLVDQSIAVADLFLDGGTIVTIRGRQARSRPSPRTRRTGDRGAALHPRRSGDRVGSGDPRGSAARSRAREARRSADLRKGTVQTFFDLADGAGLKLTTARYYRPKGKLVGIKGAGSRRQGRHVRGRGNCRGVVRR